MGDSMVWSIGSTAQVRSERVSRRHIQLRRPWGGELAKLGLRPSLPEEGPTTQLVRVIEKNMSNSLTHVGLARLDQTEARDTGAAYTSAARKCDVIQIIDR
jgi:hypothetical protein